MTTREEERCVISKKDCFILILSKSFEKYSSVLSTTVCKCFHRIALVVSMTIAKHPERRQNQRLSFFYLGRYIQNYIHKP